MGIEVQIAMFLISTAFQVDQHKKMKKRQEAAAEARKGSQFTVQSDAIALPLVYGKQLLGGVQFDHKISTDYSHRAPDSGTNSFVNNMGASVSGTKNEFMYAKQAICVGGINRAVHVTVNSKAWNHREYQKGQRIVVHPNGGASTMLTANGYSSFDRFTNIAYAEEVFRLDREENNYSGAPNVQFYVEGMKIRKITESGGTYTVNTTREYSNNPAYVLLDYLTNSTYGKGLDDTEINLETFYNAAQVCDETVLSGADIAGHVHGAKPYSNYPTYAQFPNPNSWGYEDMYLKDDATGNYYRWSQTNTDKDNPTGQYVPVSLPTRNIPLYECNVALDTEKPIRDNIEAIMTSMNYAELTWDSDGKYKLSLEYPETEGETTALVTQAFDEDNIVLDTFNTTFPSASDRFNHMTISYLNEHEDFKSDSVSWPPKGGTVHNTYVGEDNNQQFESSVSPDTITDPYHALAKAEQLVRSSRAIYTVDFVVNRDGLKTEPGDFITVLLPEAGITTAETLRVQSVEIQENFNAKITAYKFDEGILAWNIADGIAYPKAEIYDFATENVTNLALTQSSLKEFELGALEWDYSDDEGNGNFTYEVCYKKSSDSNFEFLGTNNGTNFKFGRLKDIETTTQYDFKVIVKTPLGQRSSGTTISNVTVNRAPGPVVALSATEELYVTNNAAGVKSRALLEWTPDYSGLNPAYYLVEYRKAGETDFTSLGTVVADHVTVPDVSHAIYDFKITPYSDFHVQGPSVTFVKTIVGLDARPSDPTGFAGNINEGQINLSWDKSTDLDVVYGGTCEIRFHSESNASASWETASVLVESLSGNTNNKTVPTLQGTFLIKFKDSRGNYSLNPALFISTFFDTSFNQVDIVDEHTQWLGSKTNCSKIGNFLVLDTNQTNMTYYFNNVVDLGEVITARVSPQITSSVTLRGIDFADYEDVSLVDNIAGPLQNASLRVEVSTTQDDPNAASPTWTSYELLTVSSFTCRGLRFRFIGAAENTNTRILLTELAILIDKKDVTKVGSATSSTANDTTVTFATPFYAGIGGTTAPSIGIGIIGGSLGDEILITSRDRNGFSYSIYNSGSRVARSIDWQAIGQ